MVKHETTIWDRPDPGLIEGARAAAIAALQDSGDRPVSTRLASYYAVDGDYIGATFVEMQPIEQFAITPTDLLAVRLMHAPIESRATRRLLGSHHADVRNALLELPLGDDLPWADQDLFDAMERFHLSVSAALANPDTKGESNPWVSTSKLCARKRPGLFPVRDENVCRYLGLLGDKQRNWYRTDWQVFQALLLDNEIIRLVDEVQEKVRALGRATHQVDMCRLRVLDAALWTAA